MKSRRAHKASETAQAQPNCELCSTVPGVTPKEVAGPGICEPGALTKAVSTTQKAVVIVKQDGCGACATFDKEVAPKVKWEATTKYEIMAGRDPACDKVADDLKVSSTPTLIFYKSGKEVSRIQGVTKPDKDVQEIEKRLGA